MIELARVTATSSVSPERFVERWFDLATHPEWAPGMDYLRLDEPFALGARGMLKVGGEEPRPFEVTVVEPGHRYADATILDGARLEVSHEAIPLGEGSALELVATLDGERAQHYAAEFAGIGDALAGDLARLVALLEGE